MDLLVPGWVEPVRQSPRAIAYGFFTHGTDPHDRPYSSGLLSRTNHLCRPPSPAHSAADHSVAWLSPRFRYYSAVRRLARHRSPLRLPAYRFTYPGATREPDESSWGHVLIFRTVPSANTLIRWVNEKRLRLHSAGSTFPRLWPTGSSSGWPPSTTARYFSSDPSDSTSRWTPCPPEFTVRWLQVRLGCIQLSPSCPFRLL